MLTLRFFFVVFFFTKRLTINISFVIIANIIKFVLVSELSIRHTLL